MIISHQHRFIFFKTRKTAGTSFEIALSSVCGPEDVITPISPIDEKTRAKLGFRGAQNTTLPRSRWSKRDWERLALRWRRPEPLFYPHIPALEIRSKVPASVWESYFKFTLVRNPWERVVSRYFWDQRRKIPAAMGSFHEFLLLAPEAVAENWTLYTDGRNVLADGFIRLENSREDLEALSAKSALPPGLFEVFQGIRAKGQHRPPGFTMSREDATLVGLLAEHEVKRFGYGAPERLIGPD